jgi:hypothetical protein
MKRSLTGMLEGIKNVAKIMVVYAIVNEIAIVIALMVLFAAINKGIRLMDIMRIVL